MFYKFSISFLIFLAVLIQFSVLPHFFPSGMVPDLALVLVIIWTVNVGFEAMLWRIVVLGAAMDIFSFWPIGMNVISLVIIAYATSFLAKRFLISPRAWKLLFILSAIALGTIVDYFILNSLFLAYAFLGSQKMDNLILKTGDVKNIFSALSNILIFFIVYWPLKSIEKFLSIYNNNLSTQSRTYRQ
jgi:rod shape-determining protein MreD